MEKESVLLRKHIATARAAATSPDPSVAAKPAVEKPTDEKEPIDWKKLAEQFAEMQQNGGVGDMRSMMRFQQRLQSMTTEELVAALDEIAKLDIPAESRTILEQMLTRPLMESDPELALTRFSDRLQDDRGAMSWQLANAFSKWADMDPDKAVAWFDQQIAAGKFDSKSLDGRSHARLQFEGALIRTLLATNPEAAGSRLETLPEDQRADALRQFSFGQLKEENQKAFAEMVRGHVPEDERNGVISQIASRMVSQGDYQQVTEYLDRIEATPAERADSASQAANSKIQMLANQKGVTREDIDAMREWVGTQSKETVDKSTGSALAAATQGNGTFKFSDAAALAVQYHESSGNDDVLVSFLGGWEASQNKELSLKLAEKISDEKRREEILKNFQ